MKGGSQCPACLNIVDFPGKLKDLGLWEAQFLQKEGDVCEVHAEERATSRADFHGLAY